MRHNKQASILIVEDPDLNCKDAGGQLSDITLDKVGLSMNTLMEYDYVIYDGRRGTKFLRQRNTGE